MSIKTTIKKKLSADLYKRMSRLKGSFVNILRMNLIKSIYINFKMLPFKQAIKLPIGIYNKCDFHSLAGKIIINSNDIHFNMIKIGYRWLDLWPVSYLPNQLYISGTLTFKGSAIISGGVNLAVQISTASMVIGNECTIGGGTIMKSMDELIVGDCTRITGGCTVMNSNMHYVKNVSKGTVARPWGKIIIGHHCWINAYSVVQKGAVIPNYSISSRNCFMSKDYSEFGENLFIVGSPAVVKSSKVQRIFSAEVTEMYNQYFLDHPDAEKMMDEPGVVDETNKKIENF